MVTVFSARIIVYHVLALINVHNAILIINGSQVKVPVFLQFANKDNILIKIAGIYIYLLFLILILFYYLDALIAQQTVKVVKIQAAAFALKVII